MEITLIHATPLIVCSNAIRTCYQSFDKSDNGGDKDKDLINRVGNVYSHSSTLEHLSFTFYIKGISRACLQELARHRMASFSVKSTRYTLLKDLRQEQPFNANDIKDFERAKRYIVLTQNNEVDKASIKALENLRALTAKDIKTDILKYCLPECYKTELTLTINARSLQNFLSLRTSGRALWEIRELALNLFNSLTPEYHFIFKECIQK